MINDEYGTKAAFIGDREYVLFLELAGWVVIQRALILLMMNADSPEHEKVVAANIRDRMVKADR